jgi:hypothetical protein
MQLKQKTKNMPQLNKKNIVKKYISRFSSGNISLQFGNYITQEVINQKKETILKYRFI